MLDEVRERADEFDVLHFHIDYLHFPLFRSAAHRILTTLHGRLAQWYGSSARSVKSWPLLLRSLTSRPCLWSWMR